MVGGRMTSSTGGSWQYPKLPSTSQWKACLQLLPALHNFPPPFLLQAECFFIWTLQKVSAKIAQRFRKQPATETYQRKQKASRQLQPCFVFTSCLQGSTPAPSSVTADKRRWEMRYYHQCRQAGGALSLTPHLLSLKSPSEGCKCTQPGLKQLLEVQNRQICWWDTTHQLISL